MKVRGDFPPAVLRRDMTLAALARETTNTGPGRSQGLTVVESRLSYGSKTSSLTQNGRLCVWMEEVLVDLTPASVEIIVPSEYPEGSCEYDAILLHEREHERVYQERVAAAVAEIRDALVTAKWLPARGNPLEAADQASAEAALNAKIRKVVDPAYANYKEQLGAAQAELDQPALYQWVSKRCSAWK
ncbi:MAG: hypothetical protein HY923_01200 [Elusimicrobia bacterium]|nr:hypothetical protein [Elusimicrobiota bacterium]